MKFKPTRTDRLSPQEREIVDRFERGAIDATEAGRLLIESAEPLPPDAEGTPGEGEPGSADADAAAPDETPEEAKARALVERIAQDVYDSA
jgi:hypothetical protein